MVDEMAEVASTELVECGEFAVPGLVLLQASGRTRQVDVPANLH